jgi:hypothetical protein
MVVAGGGRALFDWAQRWVWAKRWESGIGNRENHNHPLPGPPLEGEGEVLRIREDRGESAMCLHGVDSLSFKERVGVRMVLTF